MSFPKSLTKCILCTQTISLLLFLFSTTSGADALVTTKNEYFATLRVKGGAFDVNGKLIDKDLNVFAENLEPASGLTSDTDEASVDDESEILDEDDDYEIETETETEFDVGQTKVLESAFFAGQLQWTKDLKLDYELDNDFVASIHISTNNDDRLFSFDTVNSNSYSCNTEGTLVTLTDNTVEYLGLDEATYGTFMVVVPNCEHKVYRAYNYNPGDTTIAIDLDFGALEQDIKSDSESFTVLLHNTFYSSSQKHAESMKEVHYETVHLGVEVEGEEFHRRVEAKHVERVMAEESRRRGNTYDRRKRDSVSYTDEGFSKAMAAKNSLASGTHSYGPHTLFDERKRCGDATVKAKGVLSASLKLEGFVGFYSSHSFNNCEGFWECTAEAAASIVVPINSVPIGEVTYHIHNSQHNAKADFDIDMDAQYDWSDSYTLIDFTFPAFSSGIFAVTATVKTVLDVTANLHINMNTNLKVTQDASATTRYHYKRSKFGKLVSEYKDVEPKSSSRRDGSPPGPTVDLTADIKIDVDLDATLHLEFEVTAECASKSFLSISGGIKGKADLNFKGTSDITADANNNGGSIEGTYYMDLELKCVIGWFASGEAIGMTVFDADGKLYDSGELNLWQKRGSFGVGRRRNVVEKFTRNQIEISKPKQISELARTRRALVCPSS